MKQLNCNFQPRSSRCSSIEAFVVAIDYQPPKDFVPSLANPLMEENSALDLPNMDPVSRCIVPFMVCGDLSGWDADRTYDLEEGYSYTEPVRPPTEPAYKHAIELKRDGKL